MSTISASIFPGYNLSRAFTSALEEARWPPPVSLMRKRTFFFFPVDGVCACAVLSEVTAAAGRDVSVCVRRASGRAIPTSCGLVRYLTASTRGRRPTRLPRKADALLRSARHAARRMLTRKQRSSLLVQQACTTLDKAARNILVQSEAALRRFPYLSGTPSRSLPLFCRVLQLFPFTARCPPDAPRTEATDKGLPASVRFEASHVEMVGRAHGRGEPHQDQPGLLPR